MPWSSAGTIQLTRDWQYTEPIATGSYFRLKHTEARNGDLFAIAQCEVDADGNLSIGDTQILAVEKGINEIIKLTKSVYTDRRIAIKRITSQPSLEQETRRLFLPNFLIPPDQEITFIRRNNWVVNIEVSDYYEIEGVDYSSNFADITARLTTIEEKIDNIDTSSEGTTPPNTTSDPHFNNVVLLAHFDTNFSEAKGKTITSNGNVNISRVQSKFGGASAYFNGNGDYLSLANSADFDFGSGDFTIECFIYLTAQETRNRGIISKISPGSAAFFLYLSDTNKVAFAAQNFNGVQSTSVLTASTWHHIAVTRSTGNAALFVNGIQEAGASFPLSPSYDNPVYIGAFDPSNSSFAWFFSGFIDEFRITKGIARYTSTFSPPNQPFANS